MEEAADAAVRKPARVTPIWMVAKKLDESSVSLRTCRAFLCPSSAIFFSLVSLSEIMAISDAAKKALKKMRTIISRICQSRLPVGAGSGMGGYFPFQTRHGRRGKNVDFRGRRGCGHPRRRTDFLYY